MGCGWIGAASGRAMLTRRFVGLVNLVWIRPIRPMWWETRTVLVRRHGWQRSPGQGQVRISYRTYSDGCCWPWIPRLPYRKPGDTESAVAGRQSPGVGGTRTDAAVVPDRHGIGADPAKILTHLQGNPIRGKSPVRTQSVTGLPRLAVSP